MNNNIADFINCLKLYARDKEAGSCRNATICVEIMEFD